MQTITLSETAGAHFDFEATVRAHGWAALRPFEWRPEQIELGRIHRLFTGPVVRLAMRSDGDDPQSVQIEIVSEQPLSPEETQEIRQAVRRMLRLDEAFDQFYQRQEELKHWQLQLTPGGGRLLRCPTLFEDIIYTLCTTNINWAGTIRMVDRLVASLGRPFPGQPEWRAFPSPQAIAEAGPDFLKRETGLGYRSSYVWELAVKVSEGELDLTTFEDATRPTEALLKAVRQLRGVGGYAAATILMLLGRYEHLAIDSELRAFTAKKYFEGQFPTDSQVKEIYAPWGEWKYLAYWFDSP